MTGMIRGPFGPRMIDDKGFSQTVGKEVPDTDNISPAQANVKWVYKNTSDGRQSVRLSWTGARKATVGIHSRQSA